MRGRRGLIVGFTTIYAISAYHQNQSFDFSNQIYDLSNQSYDLSNQTRLQIHEIFPKKS
jgi:hypothetical protein